MSSRLKSFRIGAGVVAALSAVAVAVSVVAGNNTVVHTGASATDSVNFSHGAVALTFYSNANIVHTYTEEAATQPQVWRERNAFEDGDEPAGRQPFREQQTSTAHSGSATQPTRSPAQITVGTGPGKYGQACASPHGASADCELTEHEGMPNSPVSASTTNGVLEWLDWRRTGLLGLPGLLTYRINAGVADAASGETATAVGYEPDQTDPARQGIATAAVCTPDSQGGVTLAGHEPHAVVSAGREDLLFTSTDLRVDVRNTANLYSDNRVDLTASPQNFRTADAGFQSHSIKFDTDVVDSDIEIEFTTEWGSDEDSAWSRIMLRYRGFYEPFLIPAQYSPWISYEASSECGIGDRSSSAARMMQLDALAAPSPAGDEAPAFTAPALPGRDPRETGFVDEDIVTVTSVPGREFHLLADRELDVARREEAVAVIEEVIGTLDSGAATSYEGTVGLSEWTLHPVDTRSDVPVIEMVLGDGTTVQARPAVDGVELPGPDVVAVATHTETPTPALTPAETPTDSTTAPETETETDSRAETSTAEPEEEGQ